MAPSTPPPPSRLVFAAFTIASTARVVMSPRTRLILVSTILRFADDPDAARVLVGWTRGIHGLRLAVEQKRFHFRMGFSPFGKGAAHTAFASNIETGGEFAYVVENE